MNEEKLRELLLSNEGNKYITKVIKRSFQKKSISEEVKNKLLQELENKEKVQPKQKSTGYDIEEKQEFLNTIKKVSAFEGDTELDEIIFRANMKLYLMPNKKNEVFEQLNLDIPQKILKSLDGITISTLGLLSTVDYNYVLNLVSDEEHEVYSKELSQSVLSESELIKQMELGNYDLFSQYDNSLITQMKFATPETIIRDFELGLKDRLYGTKKSWNVITNFIGGVVNYPNDFKTEEDFEWLIDKIHNEFNEFSEKLDEISGDYEDREELKSVHLEYLNIVEELKIHMII